MTRYAANTVARRVVDNPGALDVSKADYKATKGALRIITVGPGKATIPAGFLAAGGGGYALGRRNGRRTVAAKGFFRQGLVPRIARKAPAAATAAKPVAHKEIAPGVKYLGASTPGMRGRQAVIKRRSYDPEGSRQFNRGAAASATGIGGLGALGFAGREAHGATRVARAGAPMAPHKGNVAFVEFEDSKSGKTLKAKLVNQRMVHDADRLKSGFAISRRGLGAGAAGLGLLAASAKTAKTRHEQRWT